MVMSMYATAVAYHNVCVLQCICKLSFHHFCAPCKAAYGVTDGHVEGCIPELLTIQRVRQHIHKR